jgi:hypothetical protein
MRIHPDRGIERDTVHVATIDEQRCDLPQQRNRWLAATVVVDLEDEHRDEPSQRMAAIEQQHRSEPASS